MYGHFFECENCHRKGAYVRMYYLGNTPPYAWLNCRYCRRAWETYIKPPDIVARRHIGAHTTTLTNLRNQVEL